MDRKEFLSQIGLGSAGMFLFSCLGGCSKTAGGNVAQAPSNVNLTVDITSSAYSALQTNGGYVYVNGIIIAKTTTGNYLAVSQACTHQGATVVFESNSSMFYCPSHGSMFNANGSVANGPASAPLKQYTVTANGNVLTITG
ncbi:MAG: Rieske (2Fe-2S) protein [Bacteroidota bacterium]|nr:Rieske (2Fe-2S) protein [Bacteroidota bacterium]